MLYFQPLWIDYYLYMAIQNDTLQHDTLIHFYMTFHIDRPANEGTFVMPKSDRPWLNDD